MNQLNQQILNHWKQLRGMTYDILDQISENDLEKALPFKDSQTLGYQFYCMTGTIETHVKFLPTGIWDEWNCSLANIENITKEDIVKAMNKADERLLEVLENTEFLEVKDNETPLMRYMILVEHEAHHQGQIINFIYALNLPIPKSWEEKWALSRE